jgi:DNA-binding CsgD family transcriptional regulator/tetratricopeptide (TPR) repeat protein
MELVGRDGELASAGRALEEARRGRARVLGITGEAGIGKSALLAAIAERADGLVVVEGRGVEHERDVPFGLAHTAMLPHVAELPPGAIDAVAPGGFPGLSCVCEPDVGPAERFHLHRAARALLELLGRRRTLVLLLDDMHWADEASIELVLHLLRRPPAVGHLIAFAARPSGPVPRLLDALRSAPGAEQMTLERLGHDASVAMLGDVADPALRERLAREAAGSPLFLRELARMADRVSPGRLPPTVIAAVEQEIVALSVESRTLAQGAAVAGDPFDPELASATAGLAPDAAMLDRLVVAGLVTPTGQGRAFAFRHPLVRRAIYDRIFPAWRLEAHERAAVALARRGAAATVRAYHVERSAHVGDEAAIALLSEAAAAAEGSSPAEAAHFYEGALRIVPDSDHERRGVLLGQRALVLMGIGRYEDARDALLDALALPGGPSVLLVSLYARTEALLGRHAEARRRLLAAREGASPEDQAMLAFELAMVAFNTGRGDDLRAWTEPAVRAAIASGPPVIVAGALGLSALGCLWNGDPDGADAALERATAQLDSLDDVALGMACSLAPMLVGVAQNLCERYAAASATSGRVLTAMRRSGASQGLVTVLGLRAVSRMALLDLDDALQHADTAEEVARLQRVPHLLHFALWARALVHDLRGEPAEAERAIDEARVIGGRIEPSKLARTAECDFAYLANAQEPERAIDEMEAACGADLEFADPTWRSGLLLRMVRAGIAAGRLEDAERWARIATEHSARLRLPAGMSRAACARAELLLARGDGAGAAALAAGAVAAAEGAGAPLAALEARLLTGRAHAAAGDAEAAKDALQRVAVDAARGGALRLRDDAARDLRRLGSRVSADGRRAARGRSDAELTERERDIAELVAGGSSNKQVAATLFLSEKTVENALTRVYAKLGVRSRTQLTRELTAA